jgi:hypothetical protein
LKELFTGEARHGSSFLLARTKQLYVLNLTSLALRAAVHIGNSP